MIRELVKIANKLDRLGLTSEADLLDSEIRKMARDLGITKHPHTGMAIEPPPPAIAEAMVKYLDTFTIGGRFYNDKMAIEKLINTEYPDSAKNADLQIRSICAYIKKELARDGGDNFLRWYTFNIETAHNYRGPDSSSVVSNDLRELESMIGDAIRGPGIRPDIKEIYRTTRVELLDTARSWDGKGSKSSQAPVTPSAAPAKTEAPVAEVSGNVKPSPSGVDTTVSKLKGWDRYMAKTQYGPSVKKSWESFVSIDPPEIGNDPSFSAFVNWYKDRKENSWGGKDKSPEEVNRILVEEKRKTLAGDFS